MTAPDPPPAPIPPAEIAAAISRPIVSAVVALSILAVVGTVTVAILAPTQLATAVVVFAFIPPTIISLMNNIKIQSVALQLDGRITQFMGEIDKGKADQRTIGRGEGREEGRKETEDRLSGSGLDLAPPSDVP